MRALSPAGTPISPVAWVSGALVQIHPDLVSASASGMEVPLATFSLAVLVWMTGTAQCGESRLPPARRP